MRVRRVGARWGTWPAGRLGVAVAMALVLATSAGCVATKKPVDPEDVVGPTRVRVENQGFADMNIFAYRGTARTRLGMAGGHATTLLTIPATLIFGPTMLRFVAEPIGGSQAAVSTETSVSAGDIVTITIPPRP